jgi:hypothetical protein
MARPFEEPVPLGRGRQLVTLEDAGDYITKLPKAEHGAYLLLIMEYWTSGELPADDRQLARIGVMRALNHGKPDPAPMPRRKRAKAYRVIR